MSGWVGERVSEWANERCEVSCEMPREREEQQTSRLTHAGGGILRSHLDPSRAVHAVRYIREGIGVCGWRERGTNMLENFVEKNKETYVCKDQDASRAHIPPVEYTN